MPSVHKGSLRLKPQSFFHGTFVWRAGSHMRSVIYCVLFTFTGFLLTFFRQAHQGRVLGTNAS